MQTLDRVQNKVGTFTGVDISPTPNTSSVIVSGDLPPAEVTDTSNFLRIDVEADFGLGFRLVKRGAPWRGGPGQSAPRTCYPFDPTMPPRGVRGVLVNGTSGTGSPAICGLVTTFA